MCKSSIIRRRRDRGESNPRIRNANAAHDHYANGPKVIILWSYGLGEASGERDWSSFRGGLTLGVGKGSGWVSWDAAGVAGVAFRATNS